MDSKLRLYNFITSYFNNPEQKTTNEESRLKQSSQQLNVKMLMSATKKTIPFSTTDTGHIKMNTTVL